MPANETGLDAAARRRSRHAVTAALGNATALGLGFVYLRRWPEFGCTLAGTAAMAAIIWNVEPPPPRFWFFAIGALALITAAAGWHAGRVAAWETGEHTIERLTPPRPFPGRFWIPASLIVLTAYAGAYLWVVTDADRLHRAQTEAHASGDCEGAIAQIDRVRRVQRIFAADRYDAMVAQADTCRFYADAQWRYRDEPGSDESRLWYAIANLTVYLEQPEPLLAEQAAQQQDELQAELLILLVSNYSDDFESNEKNLIEEVQADVAADPDSPLAQQTLAALQEATEQWREDVRDEAEVCTVSAAVEVLIESPLESGPVVDPLFDTAESVRPDAAVGCVRLAMNAWSEAEDGEEPTDGHREWAVDLLRVVVDEYPGHERAADAAAMLQELEA